MKKHMFAVLLLMGSCVWADDVAPRTPKSFIDDGVYLLSSPAHLNRENMKGPLIAVGAVSGTLLLDRTIRDHLFPFRNNDPSEDLRRLGDMGQISGPVIGTLFAIQGVAFNNSKSKETAYLSYETFIWAGLIEGGMKFAIGRKRPSSTDNPFRFTPGKHDSSFPSGHTTEAFAAATVFAEQYPKWYVVVPAYGAAAAVGFSRMYANQHWMSDVLAGAILGTSVSHILRARHRHPDEYVWHVESNGMGLKFVRSF